jgi:hypothetical protein
LIRIIALFILLNTQISFARDWGHLLTGTTETLKSNETTVGSLIVAHGVSEDFTIGISPMVYTFYDFFNAIARYNIYKDHSYEWAVDWQYYHSNPEVKDSDFDQISWTLKLNNQIKINESNKIFFTFSYQYFINDSSVYSFRPDPLGRYDSFAIKSDNEDLGNGSWYDYKIRDYNQIKRDKSTVSLSALYSLYLAPEELFLNLEAGIMGINYKLPLLHLGGSLNFEFENFDLGLGLSWSYREIPKDQKAY